MQTTRKQRVSMSEQLAASDEFRVHDRAVSGDVYFGTGG